MAIWLKSLFRIFVLWDLMPLRVSILRRIWLSRRPLLNCHSFEHRNLVFGCHLQTLISFASIHARYPILSLICKFLPQTIFKNIIWNIQLVLKMNVCYCPRHSSQNKFFGQGVKSSPTYLTHFLVHIKKLFVIDNQCEK